MKLFLGKILSLKVSAKERENLISNFFSIFISQFSLQEVNLESLKLISELNFFTLLALFFKYKILVAFLHRFCSFADL